ncbi:RNA-directed DNA polymerase, eukaryota [Tanacetum coccineum]
MHSCGGMHLNGILTSFWDDDWCGIGHLKILFPRIYLLVLDKGCNVANRLPLSDWSSILWRHPRGGIEMSQFSDMLSTIKDFQTSYQDEYLVLDGQFADGIESQQWNYMISVLDASFCILLRTDGIVILMEMGCSRVKDIRSSIDSIILPSDAISTRWVKFVPIKINVFVWRARLDRLPTRVNLDRRGVTLDSVLCPVCGMATEDSSHVLFRCELASLIIRKICRWWELDSQVFSSFADWDVWFSSIRLSTKSKLLLEGVFFVAWWYIWYFRNQLIFSESPPRRSVLFDDIVARSFSWCNNRCNVVLSWENWLKNPHLILL